MHFQLIDPPTVPESSAVYSQVLAARISPTCTAITVAGQVGLDAKTGDIPTTLAGQVQVALQNLGECLRSVGATPADITNMTHYVVGLDPSDKSRSERSELFVKFLDGHRPPAAMVGVSALAHPSLLYELQVTALVYD